MTYAQLLTRCEDKFKNSGIEEYKSDAWILFEYVFDKDRTFYLMHRQEEAPEDKKEQFEEVTDRRVDGVPVQYITNRAYFMGHEFYVDENVLIPRFDTEVLVGQTAKLLKAGDMVLDMCTGSGCIIISLMLSGCNITGTGCDIMPGALEVAKKNASRNGVEAGFIQGDLFENVTGMYDVIVSNPPYIRTEEIAGLNREVKSHEPYTALDGHADGLFFYEKITGQAAGFLKQGGYLCYEIGCDQGSQVSGIMKNNGYTDVHVVRDLAGLDRVVIGRRS